jgi:hypothetical protein
MDTATVQFPGTPFICRPGFRRDGQRRELESLGISQIEFRDTVKKRTAVTLAGAIVFYALLALARAANRFGISPQWLRRFEIEKHTLY